MSALLYLFLGTADEATFSWSDAPKLLTLAGWKALASLSSLYALVVLLGSTAVRLVLFVNAEVEGYLWNAIGAWLLVTDLSFRGLFLGSFNVVSPEVVAAIPFSCVWAASLAAMAFFESGSELPSLRNSALCSAVSLAAAATAAAASRSGRGNWTVAASAVQLCGVMFTGAWSAAGAALAVELVHQRGTAHAACVPCALAVAFAALCSYLTRACARSGWGCWYGRCLPWELAACSRGTCPRYIYVIVAFSRLRRRYPFSCPQGLFLPCDGARGMPEHQLAPTALGQCRHYVRQRALLL
jgi:hypothetical protein